MNLSIESFNAARATATLATCSSRRCLREHLHQRIRRHRRRSTTSECGPSQAIRTPESQYKRSTTLPAAGQQESNLRFGRGFRRDRAPLISDTSMRTNTGSLPTYFSRPRVNRLRARVAVYSRPLSPP